MMLLTVPVLAVPLEAVGVDLIWFGVFMIIMAEIGLIAPPIGLLTFIVHRIIDDPEVNLGRRIPLTDVFKGVMPFVVVALAVTILLIFVPELATWLPSIGASD
jgi:C4-dicarboxylate transporter DctM subunit